jgi:hypothetical protein
MSKLYRTWFASCPSWVTEPRTATPRPATPRPATPSPRPPRRGEEDQDTIETCTACVSNATQYWCDRCEFFSPSTR